MKQIPEQITSLFITCALHLDMRKFLIISFLFMIPASVLCQSDTTLIGFKKLFRWKPLPYEASYNNKEFQMDSIWNSVDDNGYIHYRAQVKRKPDNLLIPKYMSKRFLKMDTVSITETGDTLHAEFFAIGYVGGIKNVFCYVIERQFAGKYYRSSEKHLFTFDKKCKQIDKLLLTHEIPGATAVDNFDILNDHFDQMTWFEETKGNIYADLSIDLENEIGKLTHFHIKENGKILKK